MKIQTYYDNKTRNAILTDLMKKTPSARHGADTAGMHCETSWEWCNRYNKYRDLWVCTRPYWGYSEEQISGIMDHFIKGGDTTAGGVMQAITAYSQTVQDVDQAIMLEESAVRALQHA
mgnify:CR=1 FL=1